MSGDGSAVAYPTAGSLATVEHVNEAGLMIDAPTIRFWTRTQHETLWAKLDATSCFVEGPPGSGKSTAVWFWLLQRVQRTGETVLWSHFTKLGFLVVVVINRGDNGTLTFKRIQARDDPFAHVYDADEQIKICVVDGVTQENQDDASNSWHSFGFSALSYRHCHMIWVSSQQMVVPIEQLMSVKMEYHTFFSWTEAEIREYMATFDDEMRNRFVKEVVSGLPNDRSEFRATMDFEKAVAIKMYFCGCSAWWMFALPLALALADINLHLAKVENAQLVQSGLAGVRGKTAVNHIIAMYEDHTSGRLGRYSIASPYLVEQISELVGLEAIRAMYSSHWVRNDPSVHGFVFEWDIITRLQKFNSLNITHEDGSESTWNVEKTVRLAKFLRHGMPEKQGILVLPEKWNFPEFDGLYIHGDTAGGLHLVAWNASEATKHSGRVSNLLVMLKSLNQRQAESIHFASVRFCFLVPVENMSNFRMPSSAQSLLARQQLTAWSFRGFEVCGTTRTS